MAVSNYSTVPDQNTQISGINIAEGCAPSGINNAIRQLMADVKSYANTVDSRATLPSQSGQSGKFLTTNGTTASWGTVKGHTVSTASPSGGENGDVWIQYIA